jgi:uroporphyrinogen III methyltransferase/synthase
VSARAIPPVVLAGAGPGDPGLLTVAALRAIREADVLVVDRLVSAEVVAERSPGSKLVRVGKEPGKHAVPQEMIQELLIAQARAGKRVVRLKGGDPFVYGRGGEEGLALRAAGVPFRVIPGVSSAVAVPAYAGIPVTHRGLARRFTVVSGSTAELGAVPAEGWRAIASGDETLVVLMAWGNLGAVVERCLAHGVDPRTPSAAIEQGTTAAQRTASANLAELPGAVRAAGFSNPLVVVVGRVVALAEELRWFDPAEARAAALGREPLEGEPTDTQAKQHAIAQRRGRGIRR